MSAPVPAPVPVATAIASLRSRGCPACAGYKASGKSVCLPCYRRLSRKGKADLFRMVGDGYEAAIAAALGELGVDSPHWPEPRS